MEKVLDVSELTRRIKKQLEVAEFSNIAVQGEISNFKHHSSGHMYFTLKDDTSAIRAVMFRSRARSLSFQPDNGSTVVAIGSVGVYEVSGQYQLYVDQLLPQGLGDLHLAFERLKEDLRQEGLFSAEYKKPLPRFPANIGVITSPTGAALRDIVSVINRRNPRVNVLVIPALVQGQQAPASLISALDLALTQELDLVIMGRGGGSIEELWAFNDEQLARKLFAYPLPVISAVGHETDFTITDFIADCRAATPSAAAELAVPDIAVVSKEINQQVERIRLRLSQIAREKRRTFEYLVASPALTKPFSRINQDRQQVDDLLSRAARGIKNYEEILRQRLGNQVGKLDSLSPLATLSRGYAVCQTEDGQVIKHYQEVKPGQQVSVILQAGKLRCSVRKGEKDNGLKV